MGGPSTEVEDQHLYSHKLNCRWRQMKTLMPPLCQQEKLQRPDIGLPFLVTILGGQAESDVGMDKKVN